jgi:hypothetical protein
MVVDNFDVIGVSIVKKPHIRRCSLNRMTPALLGCCRPRIRGEGDLHPGPD